MNSTFFSVLLDFSLSSNPYAFIHFFGSPLAATWVATTLPGLHIEKSETLTYIMQKPTTPNHTPLSRDANVKPAQYPTIFLNEM